jgi:hypothetical protein
LEPPTCRVSFSFDRPCGLRTSPRALTGASQCARSFLSSHSPREHDRNATLILAESDACLGQATRRSRVDASGSDVPVKAPRCRPVRPLLYPFRSHRSGGRREEPLPSTSLSPLRAHPRGDEGDAFISPEMVLSHEPGPSFRLASSNGEACGRGRTMPPAARAASSTGSREGRRPMLVPEVPSGPSPPLARWPSIEAPWDDERDGGAPFRPFPK